MDVSTETLHTVVFECIPDYDKRMNVSTTDIQIEWYKNDVKLNIIGTQMILENVTIADQGIYGCNITTPFDSINASGSLVVSGERPSFLATDPYERTLEGSNVTLSCQ